jgi:[ribosomal protein S5]-alanine N-acetyltransferase
MNIETQRLTLMRGTIPSLEADLRGRDALAAELGAAVPQNWPPEHYDAPAIEWTLRSLGSTRDHSDGFGLFYFILRADSGGPIAVGVGGIGANDNTGADVLELGYSVLPQYQRRGYATEAVAAFLAHAFTKPKVTRVIAQTMPDLTPSIRVLEKNGFALLGGGTEEGAIMYGIDLTAYQTQHHHRKGGSG